MESHTFHPADLPVVDGRVYHLRLRPEDLSPDILVVGDPGRVNFIAERFFLEIEVEVENRGLRTITGYTSWGQRVSVVTSGMGTPSLEIVLNEIVALHEIDISGMRRREDFPKLNIIRVGTSGGLKEKRELGTLVITEYAVGLDNTGLFYDVPYPDSRCADLEVRVKEILDRLSLPHSRFHGKVFPYVSKAHTYVVRALEESAEDLGVKFVKGITVSNSGFFANQGRAVSRVPPAFPGIERSLSEAFSGIEGLEFENMEMEASFLLHFLYPLGHRAGVVCPVIANRYKGEFLSDYEHNVEKASEVAFHALRRLREWT